jgi:dethiobiotin synthetase
VEGAGGLMVPLNGKEVLADLISALRLPVILVINHYLGALNHSLLSIAELERRNIPVAGLVFNGTDFQNAESIILARCPAPCILRIPKLDEVNPNAIEELSNKVNLNGL